MVRLLVVDDEANIRSMIRKYAEYEGYEVHEAADGMMAVEYCRQNPVDIIIMDIMMPNLDGFSAMKEIRKFKDIPTIFLSALSEEYDRIHGFDLGIDDYVVKPFSSKELMMRVAAILKRVKGSDSQNDLLTIDGLTIDFTARKVTIDGEKVNMSPKEYELLFYLAKNRGIALTREQLLQNVWNFDYYGDDRTLDTHIKLLRKNLKQYAGLIVTLRGVGYRFEKEN